MNQINEMQKEYQFEEIRYQVESFKQQYDFFKHFTTLNTATILIIVAILEGVFVKAIYDSLVIISMFLLFVSVICSVVEMHKFTSAIKKNWRWYHFWRDKEVKEDFESFTKQVRLFNIIGSTCYGLALAFFMVFAVINILNKPGLAIY